MTSFGRMYINGTPGIREGEKQTYHVGLRDVTCLMARLLFGWLWLVVFLR